MTTSATPCTPRQTVPSPVITISEGITLHSPEFHELLCALRGKDAQWRATVAHAILVVDIEESARNALSTLAGEINASKSSRTWAPAQFTRNAMENPSSHEADTLEGFFARRASLKSRLILRLIPRETREEIRALDEGTWLEVMKSFESLPLHSQVAGWIEHFESLPQHREWIEYCKSLPQATHNIQGQRGYAELSGNLSIRTEAGPKRIAKRKRRRSKEKLLEQIDQPQYNAGWQDPGVMRPIIQGQSFVPEERNFYSHQLQPPPRTYWQAPVLPPSAFQPQQPQQSQQQPVHDGGWQCIGISQNEEAESFISLRM